MVGHPSPIRGPRYGYFANDNKTWLVVKEHIEPEAKDLFSDTNISITSYGRPYLGAPLGSQSYKEEFVRSKVDGWVSHVQSLSQVAMSQPHATYAAFTHGFSSLWQFICRTTPNICHLMEPL